MTHELLDREIPALSVGSVIEPSPENREWQEAITRLTFAVDDELRDVESPLNVNVVFHVPGRTFQPEFTGVRTGSYSQRHNLLMVQAALAKKATGDPDSEVRDALAASIDEAERWAIRRKRSSELNGLKDIVARIKEST